MSVRPGHQQRGVLLYLHGRRFQHDEPTEVYAAPLSAASGLPVLLTHYQLAPQHPYPAALDDVLAAYRALLVPRSTAGSAGCSGGGAGEQQGDVVPGAGAEAGQHAVAQLLQ